MIHPKNKILIHQRIVPHYRKGFFARLCKKFSETKIIYGPPYTSEPLENAKDLPGDFYIKSKNYYFDKSGKIFFSGIYSEIIKYKPHVVITGFSLGNLNVYILFVLKFFLRFKLILWSFGYDPFSGFNPKEKFSDKIRLFFYQKTDAVIFYWEEGRRAVAEFSKKTGHYFVAPNTLDTQKQIEFKNSFDKTGKEKIKEELGVKEKFHFVYVGRLLDIKQVDLLLRAFEIIEKKNFECRLTIIGNGPESESLKKLSVELNLRSIKFTGEILDEEITGKWIYISDAFVMPGRLGLSVVHTFCFATPVISMRKEKHYHSEGIGYIKEGFNGFLVQDGNVNELAEKMELMISNPGLSESLKQNAFETVKEDASIENMVSGFERAVQYAGE
jgi:glycosyltransferase involved in cell wall biosynthesis